MVKEVFVGQEGVQREAPLVMCDIEKYREEVLGRQSLWEG